LGYRPAFLVQLTDCPSSWRDMETSPNQQTLPESWEFKES